MGTPNVNFRFGVAKVWMGRGSVNDAYKQVNMKSKGRGNGKTAMRTALAAAQRVQGGDAPDGSDDGPILAGGDELERSNPELESIVRRQLELIGEDPEREGLKNTPRRVSRSLRWLTKGYRTCVEDVVGTGIFTSEGHRNMVMVRDIELYSLCEHHMLPFFGKAHVAYIPNGHIVGLSKIPRIVEVFARRLQVQERLTEEIASAIDAVLKPSGVGVVIEAFHLCMMMRGVEKQNSRTITSALRGGFRDDPKTREEFLHLAYAKGLAS